MIKFFLSFLLLVSTSVWAVDDSQYKERHDLALKFISQSFNGDGTGSGIDEIPMENYEFLANKFALNFIDPSTLNIENYLKVARFLENNFDGISGTYLGRDIIMSLALEFVISGGDFKHLDIHRYLKIYQRRFAHYEGIERGKKRIHAVQVESLKEFFRDLTSTDSDALKLCADRLNTI